jgi:hypothetical protein
LNTGVQLANGQSILFQAITQVHQKVKGKKNRQMKDRANNEIKMKQTYCKL